MSSQDAMTQLPETATAVAPGQTAGPRLGMPWIIEEFLGEMLSMGMEKLTDALFHELGIGGEEDPTEEHLKDIEEKLDKTNQYLERLDADIRVLGNSLAQAVGQLEADLTFQITSAEMSSHAASVLSPWSRLMVYFADIDAGQWRASKAYRRKMQKVYSETLTSYVDLATMASDLEWMASEMNVNPFKMYDAVYYHELVDQAIRKSYKTEQGQTFLDYATIAAVQQKAYTALHTAFVYVTTLQAEGLWLERAYIAATEPDGAVCAQRCSEARTAFMERNRSNWMAFMRAAEEVSLLSNEYYTKNVALGADEVAPRYGGTFDQIRSYASEARRSAMGLGGSYLTVELIVPWEETGRWAESAWSKCTDKLTLSYEFSAREDGAIYGWGSTVSRPVFAPQEWARPLFSYGYDGQTMVQYWHGWESVRHVPRLVFDVPVALGARAASVRISVPPALAGSYVDGLVIQAIPVLQEGGVTCVRSSPDRYGVQLLYGIAGIDHESWRDDMLLSSFTAAQGPFPGAGHEIAHTCTSKDKQWHTPGFNGGAWCRSWRLEPGAASHGLLPRALTFYTTWEGGAGALADEYTLPVDALFQWGGVAWWPRVRHPPITFNVQAALFTPDSPPREVGRPYPLVFVNRSRGTLRLSFSERPGEPPLKPMLFTFPQPPAGQSAFSIPVGGKLVGMKMAVRPGFSVAHVVIEGEAGTRTIELKYQYLFEHGELSLGGPVPQGIAVDFAAVGDAQESAVVTITITS